MKEILVCICDSDRDESCSDFVQPIILLLGRRIFFVQKEEYLIEIGEDLNFLWERKDCRILLSHGSSVQNPVQAQTSPYLVLAFCRGLSSWRKRKMTFLYIKIN